MIDPLTSTGFKDVDTTCSFSKTVNAGEVFDLGFNGLAVTDIQAAADESPDLFYVLGSNSFESTARIDGFQVFNTSGVLLPNASVVSSTDGFVYPNLPAVPEPNAKFTFSIAAMVLFWALKRRTQSTVDAHER